MRLISANLNGIRAAESKGFFKWLKSQEADVVCLQETRIQPEQLSDIMLEPDGLKSAVLRVVLRVILGLVLGVMIWVVLGMVLRKVIRKVLGVVQ